MASFSLSTSPSIFSSAAVSRSLKDAATSSPVFVSFPSNRSKPFSIPFSPSCSASRSARTKNEERSEEVTLPVAARVSSSLPKLSAVLSAAGIAGTTAFAATAQAAEQSDLANFVDVASVADVATAFADGGSASTIGFAVAGGGTIAALAAALTLTDPEKRRQKQAAAVGGNEKDVVRNYFNTSGFERWRKIYGETDEVNSVQLDIRQGHAQTVEKVLAWLKSDGSLEGVTVCDAGCGTGSLAIPLALEGADVSASDISSAMVEEAGRRADAALSEAGKSGKGRVPKFEASDLESLAGQYHTVACLDVLIHYPQEKAGAMISHLASLGQQRLILSFAPYTPFLAVLKRVGELFPGPSKATRAYLHAEADVEAALKAAGWEVRRREMTSTRFYFSRLLEAVPSSTTSA